MELEQLEILFLVIKDKQFMYFYINKFIYNIGYYFPLWNKNFNLYYWGALPPTKGKSE